MARSQGEAVILVVSDRRVLCIRASFHSGERGSSSGGGSGSGNSGAGGTGGGASGNTGGLRGSGIKGLDLEWQLTLDCLVRLPHLVDEDGGGTTLDFTHVVQELDTSRRRDARHNLRRSSNIHKGRMPGLMARTRRSGSLAVPTVSHFQDYEIPNPGGIGGAGAGKALKQRRVEGFYRDRPALVRTYNVVACLARRFGPVLLSPGGTNVIGSTVVVRSHFPPSGEEIDPRANNADARGGSVVISINGWEFDVDLREHVYGARSGARGGVDSSGVGQSRQQHSAALVSPRANEAGGGAGAHTVPMAARTEPQSHPSRDLWKPLLLFVPQGNLASSIKMRPVPNGFEMDAVPWNAGPYPPETDPSSEWLREAHLSALGAPELLVRCVTLSRKQMSYSRDVQ